MTSTSLSDAGGCCVRIRPDYRWGTPEGSRDFDRLFAMRSTFREKLEWLEEAEDLSLRFAAHRERLRVAGRIAEAPDHPARGL